MTSNLPLHTGKSMVSNRAGGSQTAASQSQQDVFRDHVAGFLKYLTAASVA
jgi:hypothetical protein